MLTSVIIATKNRPEMLMQALKDLQRQTLSEFEIIVVDNAADRGIERLIMAFNKTARIKVRYIAHAVGGISGARNAAVKLARGDLLVFTDDDLTFDTNWLSVHVEMFNEHPEMSAAGGRIEPHWEEDPPQWLLEYIGESKSFPILALLDLSDRFSISSDNIFFGANMVIKREVLSEYGGFQPSYINGRTVGSSEWGIVLRLQKAGRLIGYLPHAIVYHHIPEDRMTVEYVRKWAWHAGAGEMYERWLHRRRTLFSFIREAVRIALKYWRLWVKTWVVRNRRDPESIDVQFRSSLGRCELKYTWWMFSDRGIKAALNSGGSQL